jgi:phosphoribosylamine--glycine ligase
MGEWLYRLARGESFELRTKKGFQIGVRILVPSYLVRSSDKETVELYKDLPILFKKPDNLDGIHIEDVKRENGVWRVAGTSGCLLVVTGSGSTVSEARQQAYTRIKNIMIQDMFYRTDIGVKWSIDSDKLQTWGYLY